MQRRGALMLGLMILSLLAFILGKADMSAADAAHRDLLINRTLTVNPSTGDRLTIYGAGTWHTVRPDVIDVRGVFIHRQPDGFVVAEGEWVATRTISFESYGSDGTLEGGKLVLSVRFLVGGTTVASFNDFTVICLFGTPPPGVHEGVEIPSAGFTEPVEEDHRFTLFFRL